MVKYLFHITIFLTTFFLGIATGWRPIQPEPPQYSQLTHEEQIVKMVSTSGYFPVGRNSLGSNSANSVTPVCHDKRILPVWNLLKKDRDFKYRFGDLSESPDCSKMLEMKEVDLNGDGAKEVLLRGANSQLCGGTGNCGFWIFQKTGKSYRKILAWSDYVDITEIGGQIEKTQTNGYCDILLKGHMDASNTSYDHFSFNGRKYSRTRCMVSAYVPGTSPDPKWKMVTCKEYEKHYEGR